MFLSNGEEEMFTQKINIIGEGGIECNEEYSFLIIAKEVIKDYPNYHYYNPKNFFINDSICNADIWDTSVSIGTNDLNIGQNSNTNNIHNPGDTSGDTTVLLPSEQNLINISSSFILGTDKFYYDTNIKKVTFNLYFLVFSSINQESFPKNIYLYVIVNYGNYKYRNLESGETIKSKCNLLSREIKNQIKYSCEFDTNEEDILNVKSLDSIEYNSQIYEIQKSSFLHLLNKNNIKKIKDEKFNKPLYILEDSFANNNDKEFNITGNLREDEFSYTKLLFQFHLDKNNEEITKSNCIAIKSNGKKCILKCTPDKRIKTNIVDGYSDLGDGHLIVIFQNYNNIIEMKSNIIGNLGSSSSSSTLKILAIIIMAIVIVALVIVIIIIIKNRKPKENTNNIKEGDTNKILDLHTTNRNNV